MKTGRISMGVRKDFVWGAATTGTDTEEDLERFRLLVSENN
jgi:hypothetical protein